MNPLRHLPNALTCCNLLCGCFGIVWLIDGAPESSAYFVWAACVFDFLDGFAARALKYSSAIGKELDSLADMVSFGVLPSLLMYQMLRHAGVGQIPALVGFLVAVFSALRLAQFNVAEDQKDVFIGVPTPANALFLTALPFLPAPIDDFLENGAVLTAVIVVFSFLLVAPWEIMALKFKNFSWADNRLRFTFIVLAVLLLIWLKAGAIPFVILLYVAMSLVSRALVTKK